MGFSSDLKAKPLPTTHDSSTSTTTLLLGIWGHLSSRRRQQLIFLLIVMLFSGLAELVSLGAVVPFLSVLTNAEQLWSQPLIQAVAMRLGYGEPNELLFITTLAFAFAAVTAAFIRLLNLWLNGRLAAAVGSDLSCEAYRRTLYQPYGNHLQRNSSSVITATITHKYHHSSLNALLQLSTSSVVKGLLMGLLLIDAPAVLVAAALLEVLMGY